MVDIEERTIEDDEEKVVEGSVQATVDGDYHESQVGYMGRVRSKRKEKLQQQDLCRSHALDGHPRRHPSHSCDETTSGPQQKQQTASDLDIVTECSENCHPAE